MSKLILAISLWGIIFHGFAFYVKEAFPLDGIHLPLENSPNSYLCFWLALLMQCLTDFFFLYQSPSSSLCTVFVAVSSDIDKVPWISLSTNINTFETLTFILWTGQPILVELIELVNFVVKLFIANLTQIVNWLTNGELSNTCSGFSK